jgi:hypothetical protein
MVSLGLEIVKLTELFALVASSSGYAGKEAEDDMSVKG